MPMSPRSWVATRAPDAGFIQDGPFGVFVSTVDGCKQMLVWPADADVPAESRSYAAAALQARRLRCGPGRMVYWPAEWWHVAESATPSATLHLVVRERPPGLPDLAALCTAPLGDGFEDRALAWGSAPDAVGFPAQYDAALEALVEMCGDRSGMRDRLVADWLRCRTGLGFEALPPRRVAAEPEMSDALIRDGVCPIVLAARDGTTSWCAADGEGGAASLGAGSDGIDRPPQRWRKGARRGRARAHPGAGGETAAARGGEAARGLASGADRTGVSVTAVSAAVRVDGLAEQPAGGRELSRGYRAKLTRAVSRPPCR